jgi:hypothetical protein
MLHENFKIFVVSFMGLASEPLSSEVQHVPSVLQK